MHLVRNTFALAVLGSLALPALAQEPPATPRVMRITVEDIKPGSMGVHEREVGSYLALFSRAQVPMSRIGMVPVSGDQNQVVYVEGFPSFEALESSDKKLQAAFAASPVLQRELDALERTSGPLHASQRTMIAVSRPDLSYRPLSASAVGKSRYFGMTTSRIKAGHTSDYVSHVKQFNRARENAKLDESSMVYQVISGAPQGTFITFTANRSLAEWDAFGAGMEARNKALDEALGGEVVVRQRREMAEAIFTDSVSALYAANPKISNPPVEIASGDPDFWTPKLPGKVLAVKKAEPKQ